MPSGFEQRIPTRRASRPFVFRVKSSRAIVAPSTCHLLFHYSLRELKRARERKRATIVDASITTGSSPSGFLLCKPAIVQVPPPASSVNPKLGNGWPQVARVRNLLACDMGRAAMPRVGPTILFQVQIVREGR